jgi:hypothetical protein
VCAASDDPRNVVKTVASLTQVYTKKPFVAINDKDFDVMARNAIMFLLIVTIADEQEAMHTVLPFALSTYNVSKLYVR